MRALTRLQPLLLWPALAGAAGGVQEDCVDPLKLPAGLALQEHLNRAKSGDPNAMFCAGAINLYVKRDTSTGVFWLEKAGNAGDARAMLILGMLYEKGTGVAQDPAAAARWLEMAAQKGVPPAMRRLSQMYRYGVGVPKDTRKAEYWEKQAAEGGDSTAKANEDRRASDSHLPGNDVYEAGVRLYKLNRMAEAVKSFQRCAQLGHVRCQLQLGWHYENGSGVSQSFTQAASWYRSAADQNDAAAQKNLGLLYEDGKGVPENWTEAFRWYQRSAAKNYADAEYSIGRMYEFGMGVPQDRAAAIYWFTKAGEHGHSRGTYFARFLSNWMNCIGFRSDREQQTLGFLRCPADPVGVTFRNNQERLAYLSREHKEFDKKEAWAAWYVASGEYNRCMAQTTPGSHICYKPGSPPPQ